MRELAQQALDAMLEQRPLTLTHPAGWKREGGFPLPIKRESPNEDGTVTQNYRPLVILEHIHERLALEAAAARGKERAAENFGRDEQDGENAEAEIETE